MPLCRSAMCDGRQDVEAIRAFALSLEAYPRLHAGAEESAVISASCLLV